MSFNRCTLKLVMLGVVAVSLVGCGKTARRPVSGSVQFKGTRLETGTITFLAIEPPGPVGGAIIKGGVFQIPAEQGLNPGTYLIAISAPGPPAPLTPEEAAAGASQRASELLPPKYNSETTLKVEVVPSGKSHYDLTLE